MDTKISPHFWSDDKIDADAITADIRLTALWLMTNGKINLAGYVAGFSLRRFQMETGCPSDALNRTLDALPTLFVRIGEGIWVRNFIRHQLGTGKKLAANKLARSLVAQVEALGIPILKERILIEHPSLGVLFQSFSSSSPPSCPRDGDTIPEEKEKEKEKEKEQETSAARPRDITPLAAAVTDAWAKICACFGRQAGPIINDLARRYLLILAEGGSLPSAEQWDRLRAFYRAAHATSEARDKWHPRESARALAENLTDELDKASTWSSETGFGVQKKNGAAPPEHWRERIAEKFPAAEIPEEFAQVPASIRREVFGKEAA